MKVYIEIVEKFLKSDKLDIPGFRHQDHGGPRLLFDLNMDTVVAHVNKYVKFQNLDQREPIFSEQQPVGSTAYMRPWLTTKLCRPTFRSQINHVVYGSTWENQRSRELHNRCEKLLAQIDETKQRVKTLQKDLAPVRKKNKTLTRQ